MKTLFKRFFAPEAFKGEENYIDTQKKYEILKTVLFFAMSAAVFVLGYISTGSRMNLLTIVAVLGCLPASKSAVNMIMFMRFKSFDKAKATAFKEKSGNLPTLFDCVFTTYDKSYPVWHMAYRNNNLIGFTDCDCDISKLLEELEKKINDIDSKTMEKSKFGETTSENEEEEEDD